MRLIDADALIEQMEADAEHMDDFIAQMMLYASISDVKHAPTIELTQGGDLISRQDAIDALREMPCKSDEDGYVWIIRSDAWAKIDHLPSAQDELESAYQEGYTYAESKYRDFLPKRGEWIKHNDRSCWYCSECKSDNYYAYSWDNDIGGFEFQDNYCPNCGAKMGVKE